MKSKVTVKMAHYGCDNSSLAKKFNNSGDLFVFLQGLETNFAWIVIIKKKLPFNYYHRPPPLICFNLHGFWDCTLNFSQLGCFYIATGQQSKLKTWDHLLFSIIFARICEWVWQNKASTHIQFYEFEAPYLNVGICHQFQIMTC